MGAAEDLRDSILSAFESHPVDPDDPRGSSWLAVSAGIADWVVDRLSAISTPAERTTGSGWEDGAVLALDRGESGGFGYGLATGLDPAVWPCAVAVLQQDGSYRAAVAGVAGVRLADGTGSARDAFLVLDQELGALPGRARCTASPAAGQIVIGRCLEGRAPGSGIVVQALLMLGPWAAS